MKIGVIKLGARISYSSQGTSGGTGEALSIINMLHLGGAQPIVLTKILKNDVNPSYIEFRDILDPKTDDLDALLVINGRVNFFGGAEDVSQIMNYKIINQFNGPISYAYCDPELTLVEIVDSIEKKEWSSNWNLNDLKISDKKIKYISQPSDLKVISNWFKKNVVKPSSIIHFPFEQFPCLNEIIPYNDNPSVHLSYGGTMRNNKRQKKMIKYYFDHPKEIKVEMFGKINLEDFNEKYYDKNSIFPMFTGAVKYDKMLYKMNDAMCHCVIGDPIYEESNDIAQRTYESIWSSVVTFIDNDLDKSKRVYGKSEYLSEFLYVNSKQELSNKIKFLIDNPEKRKKIIDRQFETIAFDSAKYTESFVNLVTSKE